MFPLFQSSKGSFLKHSKNTLSRLSSLTSNTVNASASARGFVFQTVSPSGKNIPNAKVHLFHKMHSQGMLVLWVDFNQGWNFSNCVWHKWKATNAAHRVWSWFANQVLIILLIELKQNNPTVPCSCSWLITPSSNVGELSAQTIDKN